VWVEQNQHKLKRLISETFWRRRVALCHGG
jgi:hypothetical protein